MLKINLILVSTCLIFVLACQRNAVVKDDVKLENNAALPGYYGQWLYIKSGGTNKLPDMSKYNWTNDFSKRSVTNSLINVYEHGPTNVGGRIRAMVVDIANPNRLIIGSASGGIFISENNGSSWKAINDQALSPSITYMSQNPFTPNVIYYCTGEASGNSADLMGAGVFKSVDGGKTFAQLPSTNNGNFAFNWSVKCSPVDTNTLYVATHSFGLWRSLDGGATFSKVYNTSIQINDLELLPGGAVMFTIKGNGVFRSASGNLGSFSKVSTINSASSARGELAFCKNFPNVVYAAISGPDNSYSGVLKEFYKSSDGGKTFVVKTNPESRVNFGFTWYTMTMTVKDNDSNAIWIASVDQGYSKNGGVTWTGGTEQHADHHIGVNSGNKLYVGSDGGLCMMDWSNLNSFTSLNNGLNITQFYAGDVSPHTVAVFGGCQDNGTKESKNLAKAFTTVAGADGGYSFYHANNAAIKYYAMQNGVVYRSGNNISDNLPNSTDAKWFIHPYHVSEFNGDALLYPANQRLYYSTDAGESYKTLTTIATGRLFSGTISPHANPAVYSGGASCFVAVDSANNANPVVKNLWSLLPLGIKGSHLGCIKVVPGFRDKVYLAYSNISDSGRLYVASNIFGTPVFRNISGNLPAGLPVNWVECDPMDPEKVIFAGTDYGLYITEDGGQTWEKDIRLPSTVISCIKIHKNMKDIYFFTHGRGVFKGQVNNNGYSSINNQAKKEVMATLYPNPAGEMLHLKLVAPGQGAYTVYDLHGRSVLSGRLEGEVSAIPTTSLAGGQYILLYKTSEGSGQLKFSVMH